MKVFAVGVYVGAALVVAVVNPFASGVALGALVGLTLVGAALVAIGT